MKITKPQLRSIIESLTQEADVKTIKAEDLLSKLEVFFKSYVETALWSSTDEEGQSLDVFDKSDLSPETLKQMKEDCKSFFAGNFQDIKDNPGRAGHDFWLTRNRHGAGFWDGDWPDDVGRKLTDASHAYGEVNLYLGDDQKIYAM